MKIDDTKKLANLARIDMSEGEMEEVTKDFNSILAYIDQIKEVDKLLSEKKENKDSEYLQLKNILREDVVTNNRGFYTDLITKEMPSKEGQYLKVNQIL